MTLPRMPRVLHLVLFLFFLLISSLPAPGARASGSLPVPANAAPPNSPTPTPNGMVGLRLYMRNRPCFVHEVVSGGPAEAAGVHPGDRIVAVDGQPIDDLDIRAVVQRIKGPPGTPVTLTIERPGEARREVTIVRAVLSKPKRPVRTAASALPRLKAFASQGNVDAMMKAYEQVKQEGAEVADQALPVVVDALSRAWDDAQQEQARTLLPQAIASAPTSPLLPDTTVRLLLETTPPEPDEAIRLCRVALDLVEPSADRDRTAARAAALWSAVLGQAELASGKTTRGTRRLARAVLHQPGTMLAGLSRGGDTLWTSRLGPPRFWEALAARYAQADEPTRRRTLLETVLRWNEDRDVMDRIAGSDPAASGWAQFTRDAWPVPAPPAPPLHMTDLAGVPHDLEALRGQVVLVSLWATWCGPCRQEFELLKQHYPAWRERGMEILAVSLDHDRDAVEPFVKEHEIPFPVGFASRPEPLYRSSNVPVTFLVDRTGRLAWSHVGFSPAGGEELVARIQALLETPGEATVALVDHAFGLDRVVLKAHRSVPRVVSVAVARGENGPEIWALAGNGVLTVLSLRDVATGGPAPAGEVSAARLEVIRRSTGLGRFDRVVPVQLDGATGIARGLYRRNKGLLVVEDTEGTETRLFSVVPHGIQDVLGIPWSEEGAPVLAVACPGTGVELLDARGVSVARWQGSAGWSVALAPAAPTGTPGTRLVVPDAGRRLAILDLAGRPVDTVDARGPVTRAWPFRPHRDGSTGWVVADQGVQAAVVDLDGDGTDELAVIRPRGTLYLLEADGSLWSRVTFHGTRLSVAGGDLTGDGRDEVVLAGDGLGVVILGMTDARPTTD